MHFYKNIEYKIKNNYICKNCNLYLFIDKNRKYGLRILTYTIKKAPISYLDKIIEESNKRQINNQK